VRRVALLAGLAAIALVFALASSGSTGSVRFKISLPRAGKGKIIEIIATGKAPKGFKGRALQLGVTNLKKLPPDIRVFGAVSKPVTKNGKTKVYAFFAINNLKGVPHRLLARSGGGIVVDGVTFATVSWVEHITPDVVNDGCNSYLRLKREGDFGESDLYLYMGPWPTPPKKGFGYATKLDPHCP
jgi:hypothetical protein